MQTQPDAIPEGAGPQDFPQQPVQAPFGQSAVSLPPDEEAVEVEARDKTAVTLIVAARQMAEASNMARGNNDGDSAAKFASAALDLTKAHVLLAPIEAADDLAQSTQPQ